MVGSLVGHGVFLSLQLVCGKQTERSSLKVMNKLGVVIGRFQVPFLTEGHKYLLDTVLNNHDKVLVLIGVHQSQPSRRNPLNFEVRRLMLEGYSPRIEVLPVNDVGSNEVWSSRVDQLIEMVSSDAVLYGSRDSGFTEVYSGKFPTVKLPAAPTGVFSGTAVRDTVGEEAMDDIAFRKGVIYGQYNRFPNVHSVVDIATVQTHTWSYNGQLPGYSVITLDDPLVLVGRRTNAGAYQFPGGFVDNTDPSMEAAAVRELREETGIDLEIQYQETRVQFLGSMQIKDARYQNEDRIMSSLFMAQLLGPVVAKAGDDLAEVKWFPASELMENLKLNHQAFGVLLLSRLRAMQRQERGS